MTTPKAVSPGTLTPGIYIKVNLLAGVSGPNVGELRTLLLAPKSTSGTLTVDTEIRTGGGEETAGTAFGIGTPGHLAAKQFYAGFPMGIVDFGAPTAGAGTATLAITLSGVPTSNRAIGVQVAGREFEVAWLVGETPSDVRDKIVTGINQRTSDLPAVASAGAAGVFNVTGKVLGNISNDILVRCYFKPTTGTIGTEAAAPNVLTNLAGGTTDPTLTAILSAAQGKEYHIILPCLSNVDAEVTGATSNAERVLTHIELFNEGLNAKLQTLVYGSTRTQAAAIAAAQARNVGYAQHVFILNGQSLPCEFAGAEAGDRLYETSLDPAVNRIGNRIGTSLYGSQDIVGDAPTQPEAESALGSGVTILGYDTANNVIVIRPITAYSQNSAGGPDRRLLDVQNVDATYIIARDLRATLPQEFANAKIIKDQAPGAQEIPEGVTEERDVKTFVISRLRSWVRQGVALGSALDAAIENGELIVEVDEADATQLNIVVPISIVPPLAKFGVVVNRNPV
jgi:phage tail sheath gpL-like